MAKMYKCPRCPAEIDASTVSPGSNVRCTGCGAQIRIPSGNTSLRTKAVNPPAAVPQERATELRSRPSRGTDVRRGGPPAKKKSNVGLIVGLSVAALFVIVLVALMMGGKKPEAPAEPTVARKKDPAAKPAAAAPAPAPAPAPMAPVEKPAEAPRPAPSKESDWDQIMKNLRPGGGYDDLTRPEGATFARVKSMGKDAYPHLVKYIENEDIALGKAAVTVLNELTGQKKALPREDTKAKVRQEWEEWLKGGATEVKKP